MKKQLCNRVLTLLFLIIPTQIFAGDFFFGLTHQGANLWVVPTAIPVNIVNGLLGGGSVGSSFEWLSVKDGQGKLNVDNGSFFGFKAKDLFNHFGYGLTFGYQPAFSPFGIYANGGYKFRQFRMQPDRTLEGKEKYKLNSWSAGVGIRITPFIGLLYENGWSPILEVGTDYNKVFSCKAPNENDEEQFGSGLTTNIAIGFRRILDARTREGVSVTLGCGIPHYDYFNKDYTLADGAKPYADINSKLYSISLKFQLEF